MVLPKEEMAKRVLADRFNAQMESLFLQQQRANLPSPMEQPDLYIPKPTGDPVKDARNLKVYNSVMRRILPSFVGGLPWLLPALLGVGSIPFAYPASRVINEAWLSKFPYISKFDYWKPALPTDVLRARRWKRSGYYRQWSYNNPILSRLAKSSAYTASLRGRRHRYYRTAKGKVFYYRDRYGNTVKYYWKRSRSGRFYKVYLNRRR